MSSTSSNAGTPTELKKKENGHDLGSNRSLVGGCARFGDKWHLRLKRRARYARLFHDNFASFSRAITLYLLKLPYCYLLLLRALSI